MNRVRYKQNDVSNNRFYQMPKFLFEGECTNLSNDARVLYALLRDRHDLSLNNHWINDNSEVYLIYTRKNIEKIMGIADKTAKKAIEQLKTFGLLEEERTGLNRPNRIYLTSVDVANSGLVNFTIQETEILRVKNRKLYGSRNVKSTIQESYILRPNDTDSNQTNINDTYNQSVNHLIDRKGDLFLESVKIDLKTIADEIQVNKGIPYSFKNDKLKMTHAIHLLSDWEQLSNNGFIDESRQEIYLLTIDCLIEMACTNEIVKYRGTTVSAEKVIDQINYSIDWQYEAISIIEFLDLFIDEFEMISKQHEIIALIPYMKSCIWNCLLTYRVKLHSQIANI